MKNVKKKMLLVGILVAILLMAIGYATIADIPLTISGTASASADQANFKVWFTGEKTLSDTNNVAVTVSAQATSATVNISGLTTKDDSEYAILEIENASNAVDAESINVSATGTDTTIFDIDAIMCDSAGNVISNYAVNSGNKTYVKVSATLLQTVTTDVQTNITVTVTAKAKEVE